jgi:hypothetical protein
MANKGSRTAAMDRQIERSLEPITEDDFARLIELADEDRDRLPSEWRAVRAGVFLAQGAAKHFVDGRHGIKDFDVWSFYWAAASASFPWKPPRKKHVDFGVSAHGRNLYTNVDHAEIGSRVRRWEAFEGRRVDLMTRALRPHTNGVRGAVTDWLAAGLGRQRKGHAKMREPTSSAAPSLALSRSSSHRISGMPTRPFRTQSRDIHGAQAHRGAPVSIERAACVDVVRIYSA